MDQSPQTPEGGDPPVTLSIARSPKPGQEQAYEEYLQDLIAAACGQ